MVRAVVAAAAIWAFAAPDGRAAQRPATVFRAETDLIHLAVTVTDRQGRPVSTLGAGDFEISEDDRPQTLSSFARAGDHGAPELHAGLMLDTSRSMKDDLDTARSAAVRFIDRLPDVRDLTLVDFDATVRMSRFRPDDALRLVERIRAPREETFRTLLYDAFGTYLAGAAREAGQSVLVAFTDGGDSRSRTSYADLITMVRAAPNVRIYAIGLVEHQSPDLRNEGRLRLSRIAEESGGLAFFPYSMRQIDDAYDRILADLLAQYSLGYVSTNARRDGRWRGVSVRIRHPAMKHLRVRSRGGYYAPAGDPP